jgi:superfamily II DNA or RNA helicase
MNERETRIWEIEQEIERLEGERTRLLSLPEVSAPVQYLGLPARVKPVETPEEKIALYRELFGTRTDRYPEYWESASGKKGYIPVCANRWNSQLCRRPEKPCTGCPNRLYVPFSHDIVQAHLTGRKSCGMYAIDPEDRCLFLAADFDRGSWAADGLEFVRTAEELKIETAAEISKSGEGIHVWLFFSEKIPAAEARRLADCIMALTLQRTGSAELESYDRFFPNQDTCPKGGFGNLIFLPLQKKYRSKGKTVFVDANLDMLPRQWELLSRIHRLSRSDVLKLLDELQPRFTQVTTAPLLSAPAAGELEFTTAILNYREENPGEAAAAGPIELRVAGMLELPLEKLTPRTLGELKRLASFANPKFFELQRMRFSTWNTPRFICCAERSGTTLKLPRGIEEETLAVLSRNGYTVTRIDACSSSGTQQLTFCGRLEPYQQKAAEALLEHPLGILHAPTGTGKTVIAASLIAERGMTTLILLHRRLLVDQWIETLQSCIAELEKGDIGVLGAGRSRLKGTVDIAMLQTLANQPDREECTRAYDFLIIDECHRIPTVTFEPVIKAIRARCILGLTATPVRKDRYQQIMFMLCGPIRHTVQDVHLADQRRTASVREIPFPEEEGTVDIHQLYELICTSGKRNALIAADIRRLIEAGRSPLVISDRVEHLKSLKELLEENPASADADILLLTGEAGRKERAAVIAAVRERIEAQEPCCLLATGSLIGEGFDLPGLDTLVITMPVSFHGRLTQYIGRLHRRLYDGSEPQEKDILVLDYIDCHSAIARSMYAKRSKAYRKAGYRIILDGGGQQEEFL